MKTGRLCGRYLIPLLVVVALLLPGTAYADSYYTVDTGTIDAVGLNSVTSGHQVIVRTPFGLLWTVYCKQFGGAKELYVANSVDEGLNWTETRLTAYGVDQKQPTIAIDSNYDLHIGWVGLGGGLYPLDYAPKYISYDYSENEFSTIQVLQELDAPTNGSGAAEAAIEIGPDDEVHFAWSWFDNAASPKGRLYYAEKEAGWSSIDTVDTASSSCDDSFDMAVDKDGNVGLIVACNSNVTFWLRDAVSETWGGSETVTSDGDDSGVQLMASISGGATIWREIHTDGGSAVVSYTERSVGSWGAEASTGMSIAQKTGTFIAQEHGTGDGDTGHWYAGWAKAGVDEWYYRKFTLGSGFGATITKTGEDNNYLVGTRSLFPYEDTGDWHWNFPATGFAIIFLNSGNDGVGNGNEQVRYYLSGDDWGTFVSGVTTVAPTDVTSTTATFNGVINYTGGANPFEIGWEYGHSQTATWTESLSGNYTVGSYSASITDLEVDEIYYTRFYATNSEGTSYGEWIGFLTAQYGAEPESPEDVEGGMVPPVPTSAPGGWITDPNDRTFDGWFGSDLINSFADTISRSFVWFLLMVFAVGALGIGLCKFTRHLGITFLILGTLLGLFIMADYLDWFYIFPYLLVGFALIIREGQFSWN